MMNTEIVERIQLVNSEICGFFESEIMWASMDEYLPLSELVALISILEERYGFVAEIEEAVTGTVQDDNVRRFIWIGTQQIELSGYDLNTDEKLRLEILGLKPEWVDYSFGGLYGYFGEGVEVDLTTLRRLIDNNFILRDEYTRDGEPFDHEGEHYEASGLCVDDFVTFMEKWKAYNLKLIVYLVEPDRPDYRISPRGLIVKSRYFDKDEAFRKDFINTVLSTSYANYYQSRGKRGCYWFD